MNSTDGFSDKASEPGDAEFGTKLMKEAQEILASLYDAAAELGSDQGEVSRLLAAAKTSLEDARSHAASVEALRSGIESTGAVVAEKSRHIEEARVHADSIRSTLDAHLSKVQQSVGQIESALARIETLRAAVETSERDASELTDAIKDHAQAAEASELDAAASAAQLKSLIEQSGKNSARVDALLAASETLNESARLRLSEIEGLLPGAASAGLAHSFSQRQENFKRPSLVWQGIFIASLVALCVLALTGLSIASSSGGWRELALHWFSRLPIVASLIWLALHASREAAFSRRLEEEYAFKVATASAFVGFEKQMAAVGDSAAPGTPLHRLCEDTLRTLAEPPGRIYDQHDLTVTPASTVADTVNEKAGN